jgi:hypothetical protein
MSLKSKVKISILFSDSKFLAHSMHPVTYRGLIGVQELDTTLERRSPYLLSLGLPDLLLSLRQLITAIHLLT